MSFMAANAVKRRPPFAVAFRLPAARRQHTAMNVIPQFSASRIRRRLLVELRPQLGPPLRRRPSFLALNEHHKATSDMQPKQVVAGEVQEVAQGQTGVSLRRLALLARLKGRTS